MSFGRLIGSTGFRAGRLRARLERLEARTADRPAGQRALDHLIADPDQMMLRAHLTPDPWQHQVLTSALAQILLLCSRQVGKSTVAAALAVYAALTQANALILIL